MAVKKLKSQAALVYKHVENVVYLLRGAAALQQIGGPLSSEGLFGKQMLPFVTLKEV